MGLIIKLSLRNLFRQKRRNFLLGIVIAFGMMVLVIANSFAHGMVDVLINDVVANEYGHLVIQSQAGNHFSYTMIRDKQRFVKIIKQNIKKEDLIYIQEQLGMFGQAIGNGATDNIVVVGVFLKTADEKKSFFHNFFTLVDGNFNDFFSKDFEYPVIISQQKAKSLNVKLHDDIRIRLPMVTGEIQAAKLHVIAIANANNSFMDIILFMDGDRVKELLGYQPWESASLIVRLKNPQVTAKKYADILQQKLTPAIISVVGQVGSQNCQILAFKNDDHSKEILMQNICIISGNQKVGLAKDGVMLSQNLARKLKLNTGSEFVFRYLTKFRGWHEETLKVTAIYNSRTQLGGDIILVNGEKIYGIYGRFLPAQNNGLSLASNNSLAPILATEWKLLPRSQDAEGLRKKYQLERKISTDQTKMNVATMYEVASDVLKFEGVLNLITFIAVLVLFFIILIGVINTLRMTVRERTREIGTVRAIGMQKNDVRNEFILETLFLTAISCSAGIIAGIIVMHILSAITFNITNAFSMILKNKHLFFKINPPGLVGNFILIIFITGVTAYFPAKRAANLEAVEALRHYE